MLPGRNHAFFDQGAVAAADDGERYRDRNIIDNFFLQFLRMPVLIVLAVHTERAPNLNIAAVLFHFDNTHIACGLDDGAVGTEIIVDVAFVVNVVFQNSQGLGGFFV